MAKFDPRDVEIEMARPLASGQYYDLYMIVNARYRPTNEYVTIVGQGSRLKLSKLAMKTLRKLVEG
jgi:hypothetical protein